MSELTNDYKDYYLITSTVFYSKNNTGHQRTLNNTLTLDQYSNLNSNVLAAALQQAAHRVITENDITMEDIYDVVIVNIIGLGSMTENDYSPPEDGGVATGQIANEE